MSIGYSPGSMRGSIKELFLRRSCAAGLSGKHTRTHQNISATETKYREYLECFKAQLETRILVDQGHDTSCPPLYPLATLI